MNLTNKIKHKILTLGPVQWGFILVMLLIVLNQYLGQKDISENKEQTTGKIIEFKYINMTDYAIVYKYDVKGRYYLGRTGVSFFKCDNGKDGCVGSEFTVYYSSKNPQHSRIDLGKYEKYKTTVEFVK
jgi:hypothetical protein